MSSQLPIRIFTPPKASSGQYYAEIALADRRSGLPMLIMPSPVSDNRYAPDRIYGLFFGCRLWLFVTVTIGLKEVHDLILRDDMTVDHVDDPEFRLVQLHSRCRTTLIDHHHAETFICERAHRR